MNTDAEALAELYVMCQELEEALEEAVALNEAEGVHAMHPAQIEAVMKGPSYYGDLRRALIPFAPRWKRPFLRLREYIRRAP